MNTHYFQRNRRMIASLLALTILLVAFGLRARNLEGESIWHDEGWSIRAIRAPFESPDDRTPFAYYAAMHLFWRAGIGESPFAYRYGSVLLGLLVVAMTMRLGWRWYGAGVGLAAGVMAALSPLLWDYSQEVRAYIAVPLLALLMLYLVEKIASANRVRWRYWVLLLTVELIALYTHNLAVPLVVWLNIAVLSLWLLRRDWRRFVLWFASQIILFLLYLPWLTNQSPSGTPLNTPPQIGLGLLRDIWYGYFLPNPLQLRQAGSILMLDILGMVFLLGILVLIILPVRHFIARRKPSNSVSLSTRNLELGTRNFLLLSHVLLVPIFTTALITAALIDFHPRYYIASLPATLLLLSSFPLQFFPLKPRNSSLMPRHFFTKSSVLSPQSSLSLIAITILTAIISLTSINNLSTEPAYQHDDFAGLAAYYAALPADAVILLPFGTEPALQAYYADQMGIRARFVNLPLYSDEDAALEAINQLVDEGVGHLEFLTWYQLPADERGMYPCLLSATSSSVGEPRTFFGLMTQGYILSQPVIMQPIEAAPVFSNRVGLQSAAYAASPEGVCLRTEWGPSIDPTAILHPDEEAALRTERSFSVAAAILNPLGNEIARTDAEIGRANPLSVMGWPNLDYGQAYNLLRLPAAAPHLDYGLSLTLYSPEQPSGFDLLNEAGNAAGRVFILPSTINAAGSSYTGEFFTDPIVQSDNAGEDRAMDTGATLDITLLLPAGEGVDTLRLVAENWSIEQPVQYAEQPALSWHRFVVPPGNGGEAALLLNGTEIARYTIVDVPRAFDPPPYDIEVNADFPGIGQLVGASVSDLSPTNSPLQVTLIWKAETTPDIPYTVFVQLIGEDGSVLAQSDRMPAGDTRPTTGWLTGEYVADTHTLNVPAYSGATYLIVGLYDSASPGFPRALTTSGADFIRLSVNLEGS